MTSAHAVVRRTYRQVRRQQCLALLRAFVRRWGIHLVIAACIAGIGAPALAVWSVLPLFWSLGQPLLAAPALWLYATGGALLLWAARALLWPLDWAEAERALPIPHAQRVMSDLEVVTVALLPLALLFAAGTTVLLAQDPAWLRPQRSLAVLVLLLALAGAAGLAVAGLLWLRQAAVRSAARPAARVRAGRAHAGPGHAGQLHAGRTTPAAAGRCRWPWALLWSPLWRGVARRTAWAACAAAVALVAVATATGVWPSQARWGMAAFALLALVAVSRVNALARLELGPLLAQSAHLPLAPAGLERARAAVALAPAILALMVLWGATAFVAVRPLVWWAFVVVSCASWWVEARARPHDDATQGARWLVSLAFGVALGSESVA
jgi:hypothetical protein